MKNPCFDLLSELEHRLLEIDNNNRSPIDKCSLKITLCQDLTKTLRQLYFQASLETVNQQIHFFKTIKPKFVSELHFNLEVLNYYKERPRGSKKLKGQHINECMEKASSFMIKHCEFRNYMNMQSDHLDELYFTNRDYCPKLHGSFEYPSDPDFSSPVDPTLSCLIAADRYMQFLKDQKFTLKNPSLDPSWDSQKTLDWHGSKTDLVELIYALHAAGKLKGDLKHSFLVMEKALNVDVGNYYRLYTDIKLKKNPNSLLDVLKTSLLDKIRTENQ
ncbi:RteC domain-containing protein [Ekhidna sp.]|uniref:RteC domain-containing protein n=1 Tax=Ekhidna sp. TaxID=2608089 RepID=UPI003514C96F